MFLLGCNFSDRTKREVESRSTADTTVTTTLSQSEKDEIERVAKSFNEWYRDAESKSYTQSDYPFTAKLIKTKDNNYDFDLEPYFDQLRKLGTISDKFLDKERDRFRDIKTMIDEYYPIQNDSNYIDIYNDCADEFYYYRMSQDALYSNIEIVSFSIADDNRKAIVVLSLIPNSSENPEYTDYTYPQAKVVLEKESGKWMIVSIKPNN